MGIFIAALFVGWNLITFGHTGTVQELHAQAPCITAVWLYNGSWVGWFPNSDAPGASDPYNIAQNRAYWVYCESRVDKVSSAEEDTAK